MTEFFPSLISSLSLLSKNTLVLLLVVVAAERVYIEYHAECENHGDGSTTRASSRVVLSLVGVLEFFFLFVFFSKEKDVDRDEAFFIPFGKKRNRLVFVVVASQVTRERRRIRWLL